MITASEKKITASEMINGQKMLLGMIHQEIIEREGLSMAAKKKRKKKITPQTRHKPKKRICGKCGKLGHNIRTCGKK